MSYTISITPAAFEMLKRIADRRVREKIRDQIDKLAVEPELQGKPLLAELSGYRSVRAAGQRHRIIYRVEKDRVVVVVVAIGLRKEGSRTDIYTLAKKLFRLKLLT